MQTPNRVTSRPRAVTAQQGAAPLGSELPSRPASPSILASFWSRGFKQKCRPAGPEPSWLCFLNPDCGDFLSELDPSRVWGALILSSGGTAVCQRFPWLFRGSLRPRFVTSRLGGSARAADGTPRSPEMVGADSSPAWALDHNIAWLFPPCDFKKKKKKLKVKF